jgi:hypothetical protein
MTVKQLILSQKVQRWLSAKRFVAIDVAEISDPPFDPHDDYKVIYTAKFSPQSDQQAMLELHLTDNGYVGIAFESRQRIAKRLNVKNHREGYADGFEPCIDNWSEVASILDMASSGALIVRARIIPWYGLGTTAAFLKTEERNASDLLRRFYFAERLGTKILTKTVAFEPWR